MTPDELRALVTTLRESGVTYYEAGGVKLVLGPAPVSAAAVASAVAPSRDEDQEARLDRMAFGRLFSTAQVTRG
jgi:hypothetical protein